MTTLRHKTFIGPTFYTQGGSLNENREVIRNQAQGFVNAIGLEHVVSMSEHAMSWGPFSVVVWYRGTEPVGGQDSVVHVSNAVIARELQVIRQASQPASAGSGSGSLWWWVYLAIGGALVALALLARD